MSIIKGLMTKRGTPPQNIDKKGDTNFRRRRRFRCICGRWHHSNGPAGCMRFHGTIFSYVHHHCLRTAERPTACGTSLQALSSRKAKRHGTPYVFTISTHRELVFHPRREPHNMRCIFNGGRILLL